MGMTKIASMRGKAVPFFVLYLGVLAGAPGARAQADSSQVANPQAGFALLKAYGQDDLRQANGQLERVLERAAAEYRRAEFSLAQDFYEVAEQLTPKGSSIHGQVALLLASSDALRGQKSEARKTLPVNRGRQNDHFKNLYSAARGLYKNDDYESAYWKFRELWIVAGDYRGTLKYMAKSLNRTQLSAPRFQLASLGAGAVPVAQAEPEDSNGVDLLVLEAQMRSQAGDLAGAKSVLTQAGRMEPENKVVQRGLARVEKLLEARAVETRSQLDRLLIQATRYEDSGDVARARENYLAAQDLAPTSRQAAAGLERIAAASSLERERSVANLSPQPTSVELAEQEAEKARLEALELQERIENQLQNARAELGRGEFDSARVSYEAALEISPDNGKARSGLKKVASARLRAEDAARKEQINALLGAGKRQLSDSRFDLARTSFNSVLDLEPRNRKALKSIGKIDSILEKEELTRRAAQAKAELAEAKRLANQAEYASAREHVAASLALSPDYSDARKEMKRIDRLEADANKAIAKANAKALAAAQAADAQAKQEARQAAEARAQADARAAKQAARAKEDARLAEMRREVAAVAPSRPSAPSAASSGELPEPVRLAQADEAPRTAAPNIRNLHERARRQRDRGEIEAARSTWEEILRYDPNDKRAETYLEETEGEYRDYLATQSVQEAQLSMRRRQERLLNSPVTVQTDRLAPLPEFMRIISFSTEEEFEFYVADGAEADIFANFIDRRLRDVLDSILDPIGLAWDIDDTNLITIRSDLQTEAFKLSQSQLGKVRSLLDSGTLQRSAWGEEKPPSKGVEMTLDERQRLLVVVGSRIHVEKIRDILEDLDTAIAADIEVRIYEIQARDGPKIKSLIQAITTADEGTPFSIDRRVLVDDTTLMVRDTPENLTKIEEVLMDREFIEALRNEELEIASYLLVPASIESKGSDEIEAFTSNVIEMIKTLLYALDGESAARAQGRRLWYDEGSMHLSLIDTPRNINRVGNYINSLPELQQRRQQKIVYLKFGIAEELATELSIILDLRGSRTAGGRFGVEQVIKRLQRGDEFEIRGIRIRVTRVNENDAADREDDSVELTIIQGTRTNNIRLQELDTTFVQLEGGELEITAEDIQASGGGDASQNVGEGLARLLFRFLPDEEDEFEDDDAKELVLEEEQIEIFPFGPLNALIINYKNPALLQDVTDLLKELDKPTPQVEVETRFVQVNETRAKEFSANLGLNNFVGGDRAQAAPIPSLGGRQVSSPFFPGVGTGGGFGDLDVGTFSFGGSFGKAENEIRSLLDIPLESPFAANLINGTTFFNLDMGNNFPGINYQLKLLEAEGILNIINGPKVTMLDGIEGEFRFDRGSPIGDDTRVNIQGGGGDFLDFEIFDRFGEADSVNLTFDDTGGSAFTDRLTSVILLVTPEITSPESIILDITAEILDMDNFLGEQVQFFLPPIDAVTVDPTLFTIIVTDPETGELSVQNLNVVAGQTIDPFFNQFSESNIAFLPPNQFGGRDRFQQGQMSLGTGTRGNVLRSRKLINTRARTYDGGTIVLGGWTGERTIESTSGVPVLRNMPYLGKLLFSREQRSSDRTTLLIFLSATLID